jgi:NAD(P)-dependent dehydrogenase (short-subunit alcohol dehydrogenase family)
MKSIDKITILVTGSTDGIGKLAATILAKQQARVLIHGRNPQKLSTVVKEIQINSGNPNVEGFNANFDSLKNVRELASAILSEYSILDVLINNAGIDLIKDRQISQDGYELKFAVNYLAPFLLTNLLIPALKRGKPSRIVNVASIGQHNINFDDIMFEKNFDPHRAYRQSKLALIMFSFVLAEKVKDLGISVNALHPGTYLDTKMVRNAGIKPLGKAEKGAEAEVYLATSPELEGVTGQYFDVKNVSNAMNQAYDVEARKRLWNISMKLTGLS